MIFITTASIEPPPGFSSILLFANHRTKLHGMHHFPAADWAFQGEVMRARGEDESVLDCVVSRGSEQTAWFPQYAHSDCVFTWRSSLQQCLEGDLCKDCGLLWSVCFALSGRRAVAVGTSNDRAVRRPDNTMLLIPCGICATGMHLLGTCDEGQE